MREVTEWIGANDDQAIPARVKLRVFERCGGRCASCAVRCGGSLRAAYDHIAALVNGGLHRETNLQLLCEPCHALKTAGDVKQKAKNDRVRKRHLGIKKPRTIRSWRKFDGTIVSAERER
jgi:5-methylcytosine-specific restriction endonuclease McrA